MPSRTIPEWTLDHSNLVVFASVLVAADWLDTPQSVVDFFEKPWNWDGEHAIWHDHGEPDTEDTGWEAFVDELRASE